MAKTRLPKTYQHNNLWLIFSELTELLTEEDTDFRPTPYAFTRTSELISGAGKQTQVDFPYGYVYSDGESAEYVSSGKTRPRTQ